MKVIPSHRFIPVLLLSFAALIPCGLQAQGTNPTSSYTNRFDTASDAASWIYWYGLGNNNTPMTWDGTMDANNDPNSGSLLVSLPFGSTGDQGVWFGTFHNQFGYDAGTIYNGTTFTSISFDIHVDPSSPLDAAGDFGVLQVGLIRQGWANGGTFEANSPTIPAQATNGWAHLNQPIDPAGAGLDAVAGVNFKYTSYSGYPKTPMTFWIDNLVVQLSSAQAPAPKLGTLSKAIPGLNLFSSGNNGDQFQRTSIKLQSTSGVGWLGATTPVSYSMTITNFPNGISFPGYQAHIFLTSGTPTDTETAPDYSEANLIFLDIHATTNGTAYAAFRYKTNEPNGNAMVYNDNPTNGPAGTLGTVGSSTPLGTWSMTWDHDTNVTVIAPDGTNTGHYSISSDAAALFADPLNVYFGAQPNSATNVGQAVVLTQVAVSGIAAPVKADFLGNGAALDTTNSWTVVASDTNTVQLLPNDPGAWWVKWALPDAGFALQVSTNLVQTNGWVTLTGTNAPGAPLPSLVSAGARSVYVPSSAVGGAKAAFFRLAQQPATTNTVTTGQ